MEELAKYYRGYANINLDAIRQNLINLKENIKPETKLTAVIKADGYGHGAVPIAKNTEDIVDGYAVATINEAINLRNHKIKKPIEILGYTPTHYNNDLINYNICSTVFSYEMAKQLSECALALKKSAIIHIKVDTGMGRIGFADNDESISEIVKLSKLPNIEIEGIFTHFARCDELDKTHSKHQVDRFLEFIKKLSKNDINPSIKHCSNSAAIIDMGKFEMNMVRAGIALYGLYPSDQVHKESVKLNPALSLHSHIIHIKEMNKGVGISYGSEFVTDKKMRIATIPLGYGDGYPRNLSNKGYVLVNGKKANILGRICMDQFMVDITDIPNVNLHNKVTLVGCDDGERITIEELAEIAGTFNYEFICNIGKRVPRVFLRDGKIISTKDYFEDIY